MKSLVIATTAFLATISLGQAALASNSEQVRQLLATKECQNCNLTGAGLVLADLAGANLAGANLVGANLSRANLTGADLRGANLSSASLFGANLNGAKLSGATLVGTDLRNSYLFNADLENVDLNSSNYEGATGIPTRFANPEKFYALGVAEAQKGNQRPAIEYFSQAIVMKPDYAGAYLARGVARYQILDREGAFKDAQMAERLFKMQNDGDGTQVATAFIKELQTPYNAAVDVGKPSFMDFVGSVGSLLLQFFPF